MNITRRTALLGAATGGLVLSMPQARSAPVQSADQGLAILLKNLRDHLSELEKQRNILFHWTSNRDAIADLTRMTWEKSLVRKLIPTMVDRGWQDRNGARWVTAHGREMFANERKMSARSSMALAYDGCIGCSNGRRWPHDEERCRAAIIEMKRDVFGLVASECTADLDNDLLCSMRTIATEHHTPLPRDQAGLHEALRRIAVTMRPRANWIMLGWAVTNDYFKSDQRDALYELPANAPFSLLDGIPVYCSHLIPAACALIGHDGSEEQSLVWSPHLVAAPHTIAIDPATFQPTMRYLKRQGIWLDAARASRHLVMASTEPSVREYRKLLLEREASSDASLVAALCAPYMLETT